MLGLRIRISSQQNRLKNLHKASFSGKFIDKKIDYVEKLKKDNSELLSKVWSKSQMPKSLALQGARFETVDLSKQPNPKPAIELISKHPIVEVHDHIVACDGGGGSLGHPKIYINLVQFSVTFY